MKESLNKLETQGKEWNRDWNREDMNKNKIFSQWRKKLNKWGQECIECTNENKNVYIWMNK